MAALRRLYKVIVVRGEQTEVLSVFTTENEAVKAAEIAMREFVRDHDLFDRVQVWKHDVTKPPFSWKPWTVVYDRFTD